MNPFKPLALLVLESFELGLIDREALSARLRHIAVCHDLSDS